MALSKDDILDAISGMTVLELSELLSAFEEKFGVTAAAPMAVAVAGGGAAAPSRKRRTSLTSFSSPPAPRRSRSSRSCAS